MSLNAPGQQIQRFVFQTGEIKSVLAFRENIVDFLSKDSETSAILFDKAESLLAVEQSEANIAEREAALDALNMHIMQVCFDDADDKVLQIQRISRLIPEFFEKPANQAKFERLQELHINGQRILEVPMSIARLKNIQVLNLAANKIQQLPIELLQNLPQLRVLNLQNNPLSQENLLNLEAYCGEHSITLISNRASKEAYSKPKI